MHCYICGDKTENVKNHRATCRHCAKTTPIKVSRESFDSTYWRGEASSVPESTKREFYADYMASTHTLAAYIAATCGDL